MANSSPDRSQHLGSAWERRPQGPALLLPAKIFHKCRAVVQQQQQQIMGTQQLVLKVPTCGITGDMAVVRTRVQLMF